MLIRQHHNPFQRVTRTRVDALEQAPGYPELLKIESPLWRDLLVRRRQTAENAVDSPRRPETARALVETSRSAWWLFELNPEFNPLLPKNPNQTPADPLA